MTRLLLRLRATTEQADPSHERHKLQGFVYHLIQKSGYGSLHDKKGYKFFCFSNIFPPGDMKAGDARNFLVASPSKNIIEALSSSLNKEQNQIIQVGDATFSLVGQSILSPSLGQGAIRIISATPIVIRVPEANYDLYGIPPEERRRKYVYWRDSVPIEAFIKQLTENLIKKYNDFYGTEVQTLSLFEQFYFLKPIYTRRVVEGRSFGMTGSLWEFEWTDLSPLQRNILRFGLDTGFGELNTQGFGFVNLSTPSSGDNRRGMYFSIPSS